MSSRLPSSNPTNAKYSEELKKRLVRTVIEEGPGTEAGRSIAEISRSLGVSESYFHQLRQRWEPTVRAEMAAEAASQSNPEELVPEETGAELDLEIEDQPILVAPGVRSVVISVDIPEFMFPLDEGQLERMATFVGGQLKEQLGG